MPRTPQRNTLGTVVKKSLRAALDCVERESSVCAAVIISGKQDSFFDGADIALISACTDSRQLAELSRSAQVEFSRLSASRKPVVAAINGTCLGGGLELALACTYRIATSDSKTHLGLPEVQLGLLPGGGATLRLPRTIGIQLALSMMMTGRLVGADRALKVGLVHEVRIVSGGAYGRRDRG